MSRVSTSQLFDTAQKHIMNARDREAISLEKSASLKELTTPSQAPAEWMIAANLKDDVSVRDGISKNASIATHTLTATENVISHAQDLVQKIHELALSATNVASGDNGKHVLPEVKGLVENFIQNLNTKFGPRTLLAGQKSTDPAFDREGNFLGDAGSINLEIDRGLMVPISVSGNRVILGEGLKDGVNIVGTLKQLVQGLEQSDLEMVRGTLGNLNKSTDQLSLARTEIAGSLLQINRAVESNATNRIDQLNVISKIEEADPIKVFSDLARDQTVLRAALESTHKILSESPADILLK